MEITWRSNMLFSVAAGAAGAATLLICAAAAEAQTSHPLTVSRHALVAFGNADADSALAEASQVLQVDDDQAPGTGDMSCNVGFVRSGDVSLFTSAGTPSNIQNQSDLDAVFSEPGYAKVITSIGYCAGRRGNFAGCARTNQGNMIVERRGSLAGILWAHEFGHTVGLPHRSGATPLMTERPLAAGQTHVNQAECDAFTAGAGFMVSTAETLATGDEAGGPTEPGSLVDLSQAFFVDHIPYAEIARHDAAELAAVVPDLFDLADQERWSTIVTLMGVLGDETEAQALMNFIDWDMKGVDAAIVIDSKSAALFALAYILNRTNDPQILAFLHAATQSRAWRAVAEALASSGSGAEAAVADLRETALISLALSGRSEAAAILEHAAAGGVVNTSQISDLRRLHETIRSGGLIAYYADP